MDTEPSAKPERIVFDLSLDQAGWLEDALNGVVHEKMYLPDHPHAHSKVSELREEVIRQFVEQMDA